MDWNFLYHNPDVGLGTNMSAESIEDGSIEVIRRAATNVSCRFFSNLKGNNKNRATQSLTNMLYAPWTILGQSS